MKFKDFFMLNKNSTWFRTQKSYFMDWNNKYRQDYLIKYENIISNCKNFIDNEKIYIENFIVN